MGSDGVFTERVLLGDDGAYRWWYNMKVHGNNTQFNFMVKLGLCVSAPIAVVLYLLTREYDPVGSALVSLGIIAMIVGLPALIWKLAPPDPRYRMTEAAIEAWPKGKGTNKFTLDDVRQVALDPDIDRITLRWRIGSLMIFVPPEDYEFVKDFIFSRVPESAEKRL